MAPVRAYCLETLRGREMDQDIRAALRRLIELTGADPDRPGLQTTPERMVETLNFLTRGQREDIGDEIAHGLFEDSSRDMVLVRSIELCSVCEHHVLPFIGHAHVAYLPDGRLLGLSKIARVVDHFACRLQVQERLTAEVADYLADVLRPRGVAVVVSAVHLCMVVRGVRKQDARVVTTAWRGAFEQDDRLRADVLAGIGNVDKGF